MTDKKEKVTEMTNPLIAAFLKLQETNPENMFEAAKKAKKDYDKDGKVESEKDEVWGSRFRAAKAAGKMKEDAENDKLPKDWGEEVEQVDEAKVRSVTVQSGSAPAVPTKPAVGKSYSQMSDEEKKHFNAYTDKVAGMIKSKYRKEEVEFSEAELAHFAAVLEVGSVTPMAPTRPDQVNANDKSDRVSGRDITDSVEENKKKIEEGQVTGNRSYKGSPDRKRKAVQMALGRKHKDHPDWNPRTNPQHSALKLGRQLQKQGVTEEEVEVEEGWASITTGGGSRFDKFGDPNPKTKYYGRQAPKANKPNDAEPGAGDTYKGSSSKKSTSFAKTVKEEQIEEGRPKKNPVPETSERDARQHIQVAAGRAAAGNVIDFPHNDGTKSKITPAMGRKITAHLNGLKPSDRQAAVNKMHDSAEGLKV